MQLFNLLIVLPAIAAHVAAIPAEPRADMTVQAGCNNKIGRCDKNNCTPKFNSPWDLVGTCSAGEFNGCPCDKCNGQTDSCSKNGCNGVRGICQSGKYQGCACD
ncbi:hypothetical protein BU26DRAFT_520256 [Trematosphaeria pertusa]|uniref:EGF-like domain-containing protein n=1 Tax=Trematosphaeria pertusa TaxID=390896 RepID=A0A6A6IFA0_9PLEO|nr:uncharacterized protein BU26DRAFT_520256 [Trematosphaeria pertusa]KAF2248582.1 hypothetical protein BU26DRAFT_520256 [Trematosphaeria pertusa]